eukprot:TRINITY_DN3091_c0_g5_i1.p1 TRINITY_DN3091_c0_g5~~TRINITY_DN3091_c0_g5_i1.p1  ORF type:complete len:781 (+),score=182.41 TRINITY_DN3091_c0_g5_i1:342-2345(+)
MPTLVLNQHNEVLFHNLQPYEKELNLLPLIVKRLKTLEINDKQKVFVRSFNEYNMYSITFYVDFEKLDISKITFLLSKSMLQKGIKQGLQELQGFQGLQESMNEHTQNKRNSNASILSYFFGKNTNMSKHQDRTLSQAPIQNLDKAQKISKISKGSKISKVSKVSNNLKSNMSNDSALFLTLSENDETFVQQKKSEKQEMYFERVIQKIDKTFFLSKKEILEIIFNVLEAFTLKVKCEQTFLVECNEFALENSLNFKENFEAQIKTTAYDTDIMLCYNTNGKHIKQLSYELNEAKHMFNITNNFHSMIPVTEDLLAGKIVRGKYPKNARIHPFLSTQLDTKYFIWVGIHTSYGFFGVLGFESSKPIVTEKLNKYCSIMSVTISTMISTLILKEFFNRTNILKGLGRKYSNLPQTLEINVNSREISSFFGEYSFDSLFKKFFHNSSMNVLNSENLAIYSRDEDDIERSFLKSIEEGEVEFVLTAKDLIACDSYSLWARKSSNEVFFGLIIKQEEKIRRKNSLKKGVSYLFLKDRSHELWMVDRDNVNNFFMFSDNDLRQMIVPTINKLQIIQESLIERDQKFFVSSLKKFVFGNNSASNSVDKEQFNIVVQTKEGWSIKFITDKISTTIWNHKRVFVGICIKETLSHLNSLNSYDLVTAIDNNSETSS